MSNPEDKLHGQDPAETQADAEKLWREEESIGIYSLPLPSIENSLALGQALAKLDPPEKEVEQIGSFLVSRSPESHQEAFRQALDFLIPDGTPVLAAADGEIVAVVIDNTVWGPSKDFRQFLNYITIKHPNGERSQYCHLATNSLPEGLAVGKQIPKGTQIALTGKTGWTDRDHLHFIVFRPETKEIIDGKEVPNPHGFKSLKPKFENK